MDRQLGAQVLTSARTQPADLPPEIFVAADLTRLQGCEILAEAALEPRQEPAAAGIGEEAHVDIGRSDAAAFGDDPQPRALGVHLALAQHHQLVGVARGRQPARQRALERGPAQRGR